MPEWSNGHAWKACVRETVPRVRIPVSPPVSCNPLLCEGLFYCERVNRHQIGITARESVGAKGSEFPRLLRCCPSTFRGVLVDFRRLSHFTIPLPDSLPCPHSMLPCAACRPTFDPFLSLRDSRLGSPSCNGWASLPHVIRYPHNRSLALFSRPMRVGRTTTSSPGCRGPGQFRGGGFSLPLRLSPFFNAGTGLRHLSRSRHVHDAVAHGFDRVIGRIVGFFGVRPFFGCSVDVFTHVGGG